MSYLDRFSSVTAIKTGKNLRSATYQLAAMTSLNLAIKLFQKGDIDAKHICCLSQGRFNQLNIAEMELIMLMSFSWYLHPPTPLDFARDFILALSFLSKNDHIHVGVSLRLEILEFSTFLTELSVWEDCLVEQKPSTIGFASVLLAIDAVDVSHLPLALRHRFLKAAEENIGLTPDCDDVLLVKERLHQIYQKCSNGEISGIRKEFCMKVKFRYGKQLLQRRDTRSPDCVTNLRGLN
eukprot:CAMPEP_0195508148 /NCGR_PEP_ID=MMETSP0794_2-20130614/1443_1 /TAXON_ID=515487 /ORGANISM="Stephanopyxis turris, Strain CCMP 815" /LENGTH=236 /DNA_ID=CAMNT_0040635039 /DNA_START=292 /DNA_END=1002 /DNA_ORIENTATION=-